MRLHFESEEDLRRYIAEQVLTTTEVTEMLGVTRQMVNKLVKGDKLHPFKSSGAISLFFKTDVEKYLKSKG
ncbi:helix-turn-helix domain-containing protein [Fodinisporobacter ferrooxydans]|uniref:Helix-turn-helix domain-containing protein n=1 Tax=Fodinisporobacter ferrooxydans TaxID=2901836 RepID=A0ABY4CK14_9BACL|nr:helix-turn-helix domain-containing protein [Alicyclobacillaceae bacterium MYW30-H2]